MLGRRSPHLDRGQPTAVSIKSSVEKHRRFLTEDADVWSQNAWDHVAPPEDQGETIARSLSKQRQNPVPLEEKQKYNEKPAKHWDNFYKMNASNFFRNRKWLHNEFPELIEATQADAGAGNSAFPLLSVNQNPKLHLHAYDYSPHAVKLVQNNPLYLHPPLGTIRASVWDVTSLDGTPADIPPGTVDIVILMLRPGGFVLLRDYGRHDLTQLRFKGGRMLDENFYIRGDKTRVYFFGLDELSLMFTGRRAEESGCVSTTTTEVSPDENGEEDSIGAQSTGIDNVAGALHALSLSEAGPVLAQLDAGSAATPVTVASREKSTPIGSSKEANTIHPNLLSPFTNCLPHPLFTTEQLGIDRRLIVNRKRQLKMYRVWMQGKFRKL
ncbi:hypothetical protein NLJ89_g4519 [Agrocybe chaxingu]|uniref:tRNA N(3)-methylcytidine methyltransferase n=1 Tax=Agrocybe chaxingu TaxID=84603 RepID=A0A9W8K0B7_9AGAR|nr:hypothetical protein NLJ89_g4519 [Agrocybe chaxingu]